MAQCWDPEATLQKEPGPSKVIPPTDHMWLGNRKRTSNNCISPRVTGVQTCALPISPFSNATPQKEPGPSKIIPPTNHTWLGIRKRRPNIWRLHWGVACISMSCLQSLESHVIKENLTPNTQSDLIQQLVMLSHNNIISYLFMKMLFHLSPYQSSRTKACNILIMSLLTP